MHKISFRKVDVDGVNIFYREAGLKDAPPILLLHGFPSAGHMFRDLIPQLADRFRVIAPDLPGFGQSDMPDRSTFAYTFHNIARLIDRFTEAIGLRCFAIYVFDYGAPTGFRLAIWHPDRITAIITQNGNAYVAGLSDGWKPIRSYWENQQFLPGTPGRRQRTAGSARRLQDQRRALSGLSGVFPQAQSASSRGMGQQRPVFSACGRRGVCARYAGLNCALLRYRTLRARDAYR
jgi:pimeloyl-ACP methyl ester carboxylesterase